MDKRNAALAAKKCWEKLAVAHMLYGQYGLAVYASERSSEADARATALKG